MPNLFGVDIAGVIAQAMGNGLLPATLIKTTAGERSSGEVTAGTNPSTSSTSCRGFIEDYKDYQLTSSLIKTGDKKITLLGGTLAGVVPKPGDKITIESSTYNIIKVMRDPAAATYECQSRG